MKTLEEKTNKKIIRPQEYLTFTKTISCQENIRLKRQLIKINAKLAVSWRRKKAANKYSTLS